MPDQPSDSAYLQRISRKRIDPPAITPNTALTDLIDDAFLSYNAGRLREGCQTVRRQDARRRRHRRPGPDRGADAGRAGHVVPGAADRSRVHRLDRLAPAPTSTTTRTSPWAWTCTRRGPDLDDLELRENQVIRIYDIVFDYENLLGTDRFYRTLCRGEAFQQTIGTAEFHHLVGKYLAAREERDRPQGQAACWPRPTGCGVPCSRPVARATAPSA